MTSKVSSSLFSLKRANILDLHRLSVPKALGQVFLFLSTCQEMQALIITGKGKHSMNGTPKIKPAVKRLLSRLGYKFEEAPSKLGGEGAVIVFLKNT